MIELLQPQIYWHSNEQLDVNYHFTALSVQRLLSCSLKNGTSQGSICTVALFQVNSLPGRFIPEEETQEVDLSGWHDPAEVSGNTVLAFESAVVFAAEGKASKASVEIERKKRWTQSTKGWKILGLSSILYALIIRNWLLFTDFTGALIWHLTAVSAWKEFALPRNRMILGCYSIEAKCLQLVNSSPPLPFQYVCQVIHII